MSVAARELFAFDDSFARELPGLAERWQAAPAPAPALLAVNEQLAAELGLDLGALRSPEGIAVLVGNAVTPGSTPVAQAYAGHQFGGYSPRLGDGRALLLGEVYDADGRRRDVHLKGSGRTPFSRGGDGKAAVGPMLREYVVSEAMHTLGIPSTRALAVVATGERIQRDSVLPGAVLVRIAASHLRVGSFQYAAAQEDPTLLRDLADHAIRRHHPDAAAAPRPYLALFAGVVEAQASLVAQWMLVGFVHGVMNTDNTTISGETIDYGPCAFMDAFDPATVFSSIDHGGRYAYGNQPQIVQWNLARLAESLLPLIDDDRDVAIELATDVLHGFVDRFRLHWTQGMLAKLGLVDDGGDPALIDDLLAMLHAQRADHTGAMRALSSAVRGDDGPFRALLPDPTTFDGWRHRWRAALDLGARDAAAVADAMDRVNPIYIPRNHLVEAALTAATDGDLAPLEELLDVLADPYVERPGLARFAQPAPDGGRYRTFCGT